jgi:hypothetical protein
MGSKPHRLLHPGCFAIEAAAFHEVLLVQARRTHEPAGAGRLECLRQLADVERAHVSRDRDQLVPLQKVHDLLLSRLARRQELRLILRHALCARRIRQRQTWIFNSASARDSDPARFHRASRRRAHRTATAARASASGCRSARPSVSTRACVQHPHRANPQTHAALRIVDEAVVVAMIALCAGYHRVRSVAPLVIVVRELAQLRGVRAGVRRPERGTGGQEKRSDASTEFMLLPLSICAAIVTIRHPRALRYRNDEDSR